MLSKMEMWQGSTKIGMHIRFCFRHKTSNKYCLYRLQPFPPLFFGFPALYLWHNELFIVCGKLCLNIFLLYTNKIHRYKSYFKVIDYFSSGFSIVIQNTLSVFSSQVSSLGFLLLMLLSCMSAICVCIFLIISPSYL